MQSVALARPSSKQLYRPFLTTSTLHCHVTYRHEQTRYINDSGVSESEVRSARQYCLSVLRKHDTPSFLLQNYIPSRARDAYVAIRAFNVDVARTADTTSTKAIASMRLQFHKDSIASILSPGSRNIITSTSTSTPPYPTSSRPTHAQSRPRSPIETLLSHAVHDLSTRTDDRKRFTRSWFNRLISTREKSLSNSPFTDLGALESYAENTYSTLLYLTLQALPVTSVNMDHLASHIGKAAGIVTVLRGLPLVAFPEPTAGTLGARPGIERVETQGAVMLPLDVMARHGVREEDVLRQGPRAANLRDAVFEVATRANDHLLTARSLIESLRAGSDGDHEFEHADEEEHRYEPSAATSSSSPGDRTRQQIRELDQSFGVFMPAVSVSLWLDRLQKHDFDIFALELRKTDWRLPFKAWWSFTRRQI